jgi:phosphoribosylaminoimidazolecarboxamide formyltransferase/IMP cyclohydrolase
VPSPGARQVDLRTIVGGALVQERDAQAPATEDWTHAAGPAPAPTLRAHAATIWAVVKHLKSNAIAIGGPSPERPGSVRLFGAGAGQMDRVASCRIAVEKAGALATGAIACSDAFFPFADGPEVLLNAGVTTLVHTGGSKRDQDTIDLCNRRGVTCLLTGARHFRH